MRMETPAEAAATNKPQASSTPSAPIKNARLLTKAEDEAVFGSKPVHIQTFDTNNHIEQPIKPEEPTGSWNNIGDIATHVFTRAVTEPLAGLTSVLRNVNNPVSTPLYQEVNDYNSSGVKVGSHSELTDYGKSVDAGKVKDPVSSFIIGLDAYNNVTSGIDKKNPLPNTFLGNTATGALHIAPDLAMLALMPEGELAPAGATTAEGVSAMEGADVLKKVSTVNKLKGAVWNPFTKLMATKGFLKGYEQGQQKGESSSGSMVEGLKQGGGEAVNAGIMGLLGGVSGEYIAPKVYKSLVESGIVEGGKITQLGVNALSDASLFGAYPIMTSIAQGKPINIDEIQSGIGMGLAFGGWRGLGNFAKWDQADEQLKNVWADRYAMATQNFMNATPGGIKDVMDFEGSDSDLFAKATEFAAKAKTEIDPEKKIQYAGMASTLAKMSDIKGTVDAIVHDAEGFKDNVNESELPADQKEALIQRVDEIAAQYGKKTSKKIEESPAAPEASVEVPALPSPAPVAAKPVEPVVEKSMLDSLDDELDSFKQASEPVAPVTETTETVIKKPESEIKPADTEIKPAKVETKPKINSVKQGDKVSWNVYGNEPDSQWTVGEETTTRSGKKAIVLKRTVEEEDGSGFKQVEHIVNEDDFNEQVKHTTPDLNIQETDIISKAAKLAEENKRRNEQKTEDTPAKAASVEKPVPTATKPKETPAAPANEAVKPVEVDNIDYTEVKPEKLDAMVESKEIQIKNIETQLIKAKGDDVKSNLKNQLATANQDLDKMQAAQSPGDKYYIAKKNEEGIYDYEETPGKDFQNDHGLELFTHDRGDDFAVTEATTGLKIADGATEAEAIANANKLLSTKTPAEMQAIIKAKHESGLKSPRGTKATEGADTKNTEAVITKASATISKAETTSGGDAESAGVVAEIDNAISEIDKELESLGSQGIKATHNAENGFLPGFLPRIIDNKDGSFHFSVDDTNPDGKRSAGMIGLKTVEIGGNKYLSIVMTNVRPEYEGVGLATQMYRHILNNLPEGYSGLISEKSTRWNEEQIPAVHKKIRDEFNSKTLENGDTIFEPEGKKTPPEPETTNEPPKDEKQSKREKYSQELKDAKAAFMKTFNKAMMGVNPDTIAKGIKLLSVYAKIGIHDFSEISRDLADELGSKFKDVFEGLKASYGAFATQEATDAQLDLMTDIREVRKATIDDYLPKIDNNDTGSELNTVDENTSAVDAGQSAGGTAGEVQQQQAKGLPAKGNGKSGKAGNVAKAAGNEPERDRGAGDRGDVSAGERGTGGTGDSGDNRPAVSKNTPKRVIAPADQNHVIKPDDVLAPSGAVAKFNANVDALFLLKKLEQENRNPTPAEKQQLAQFVGWGGLSSYLKTPDHSLTQAVDAVLKGTTANVYDNRYQQQRLDFRSAGPVDVSKYDSMGALVEHIRKQLVNAGYSVSPDAIRTPLLKSMLTTTEYSDAQQSTVTAFYTERNVIQAMWNIVTRLGFKGGAAVESSAGIGHIFGMIPKELQNKMSLTGYELDSVTGRILKKLYPQANITVGGFEAARVPQNSQDLVITNVPFGPTAPYDKNFPELSKFSLHNYFIAKNLKLLKPGGVAMIVTSSSTLDSGSSAKFREWVTSPDGGNSYLVGAIRLPSNVFDESAGTQVTSDVLVFQKRGQTTTPGLDQPFRYSKEFATGKNVHGEAVPIDVNEYYHEHPENMLGTMMTVADAGTGNRYGDGSSATLKAPDNFNLQKALAKVEKNFPTDIVGERQSQEAAPVERINAMDKKEGSLFTKDKKVYRVEDGTATPMTLDAKQSAVVHAYVELKESLLNLISLEQSETNAEANIEAQRKELNKQYDAYVKKHGNVNGRTTNFINDSDIDFPIVSALENVERKLETVNGKNKFIDEISKGDILTKRINFPRIEPTKASDITDAINISLNYRSGIDLGYMSRLLGTDEDTLRDQMVKEGLAFENPDTGILETPETYLSGFVRDKLRKAEAAAANDPKYANNVTQLKKIIPEDIPSSLISYSLGSAWIPAHVYDEFATHIFDGARVGISYLPSAGKFIVNDRGGRYSAAVQNTYAAGGLDGLKILDATLNNRQIVVTDKVEDADGKKKEVKNLKKTAEAQAMQAKMQEDFESWIRSNEPVQKETEQIYNDVFNGQVLRTFRIPEFDYYPDAAHTIKLNDHQKRGVSRGLSESTLFAHQVGTGKTFLQITTAMEMRRLGTARKPMIAVQNATLGQFVKAFKRLYPGAKILSPSKKEMQADGRKKLFAKIATGDWDAVILPHSQITMIPDDPERQKAYIREQIEEMEATMLTITDKRENNKLKAMVDKMVKDIEAIDASGEPDEEEQTTGKKAATVKNIAKKGMSIEAGMQKILDRKVDNVLNFEQLGVDALFVDEADEFKKLGFQTSMSNIKGIDTGKSQRAQSIYLKSRWVQEKTGGKNVNFYTGTPISNTMAEAWTMLRFLRPDILEHLGITYFDQFAKTFGQIVPSLEQTAGGTFKIQSRFSKFQNLPEFINAFKTMTDVVLTSDVKEFQDNDSIPKIAGGKPELVAIPQSPELKAQIQIFRQTLEMFDKMSGKEKRENSWIPLVTRTKAKQAAIDLRLLSPANVDSPESKTNQAVKRIYNIWKSSKADKSTQMVFSDMYQSPEPKNKYLDDEGYVVNEAYGMARFNLFEDIKKKLVSMGVPADEISILTEPKYDKLETKNRLFDLFNEGAVRIALGTTAKMGVGVNAQNKMIALHNLDVPQRPREIIQRLGRAIRQGNENKIVQILNYGVEKTLDASGYQTLASKEGFINQIMKGENLDRIMDDAADESSMGYEEMMAHLSDSPFAMQKLMVDNKLNTEKMKQNSFTQRIITTNSKLRAEQSNLRRLESKIAADVAHSKTVSDKMPGGVVTLLTAHGQPDATEKFGVAADEYINKLIDKYDASPTKYAKGGLELNGIRVELEVDNRERISRETGLVVNTPQLKYTIPELGVITDSWGHPLTIESNSGTGLLSSAKNQIEKVLKRPAETQREIDATEKNIGQLQKDADSKFDDTKLKQLQAESDELKEKMIADGNKKTPPDDDNPGGGQTPAEYIKDQSNIKPALDFLDSKKAKSDGKFMSTIVPIPPAVWNGAIDVMKGILRATNSTQKAIRVAAKYIIDRGGSEAQAKDFELTMGQKMANTNAGKKATVADTDEAYTEESMIKAAAQVRAGIKQDNLSPDEIAFANMDLQQMTKKELHRYIEVAAVLAVDPDGVLSKDVSDLMDRVANRLNPKSGTAVPPPPTPPTEGEPLLPEDDDPRRRIPRKNKLPMDPNAVPEDVAVANTVDTKANYSIWGNLKDIHVRNLEQLKQYGKDMTDMTAYRSMIQLASSKSQSSVDLKLANDRITKLIGEAGYKVLREALIESRLRGTRQRFKDFATNIARTSDNELDELFEGGKMSAMYNIIKTLEGYEDDENPAQTIATMLDNGQYDDAREYMSDMFDAAANNVAYYATLSNGQTFDDMVTDGAFNDTKFQQSLEQYKNYIATPFKQSHETNDGIFSDALGPLDTYYPLTPVGKDAHRVLNPSKSKYVAPENINNKFTTGSADAYSSAISDLARKLSISLKTNNKAAAIRAIENAGLTAKVSSDSTDSHIRINDVVYEATKVPISDARTVIAGNQVVHTPVRYILVPNFLYKEIKEIIEGRGDEDRDSYTLFGRIMNATINLMLGGPGEAIGHSYRLLSSITNSMPYMQEWAYKNGIIGHAGGLILNNPLVKTFAGMGKVLFTKTTSDAFAQDVMEMAKIGLIPEKTWTHTYSKQFAESMGIEATQFPIPWRDIKEGNWKKVLTKGKILDFSPVLYGKKGFDLKARVVMYRLVKAMNPDATPEQHIKMQADMGQYTQALQGRFEKLIKKNGLGPFATFSRAYYRAGLKNIFLQSPLPFNAPWTKSFEAGDKTSAGKWAYYKFAQIIGGGVFGLVAYWMFIHKELTGEYPDENTGLLKMRMPEWLKNNKTIRKFYYNERTNEWDDISLAFANIVADRGLKSVGAYKGYDAYRFGGTPGQVAEAAEIQAINTYASQYTASPAVSLGFTGITGDAPYITSLRGYNGAVDPQFLRKAATAHAGLQIPTNLASGFMGINGLFESVNPISGTVSDEYNAEDYETGKFFKSMLNIAVPNLFTPHTTNKSKYIKKTEKAIETTIKKEHAKKHKH